MASLLDLAKKLRDSLDQDKSMGGFQLAKGGLGNQVKNTLNQSAQGYKIAGNALFNGAKQVYNQNFNPNNPAVRMKRNQGMVAFNQNVNDPATFAPRFTPVLHELSTMFPQIPNTVEKVARFIPDKSAEFAYNINPLNKILIPNANPKDNPVSNLIGGFARGMVEEDPLVTSANRKINANQRYLITPEERKALSLNDASLFMGATGNITNKAKLPKISAKVGKNLSPSSTVNEKQINNYLSNAYKVYAGQKPYQVVAKIANDVATKTGYKGYENVIVKQSLFDKIIEGHPNIFKDPYTGVVKTQKLFEFVKTLNIPDSVRQSNTTKRLNYFRQLENDALDLVVVDKNIFPPPSGQVSSVITDFRVNPNKPKRAKYLDRIKNTSEEVFSSGRTDSGYPSSNMAMPSARDMGPFNFPGPQNTSNIPLVSKKVKAITQPTTPTGNIPTVTTTTPTKLASQPEMAQQGLNTQKIFPQDVSKADVSSNNIIAPNKQGKALTEAIGSKLAKSDFFEALKAEARKYKSAEEFIRKIAGIQINANSNGNEIVRLFPSDLIKGKGITRNELLVRLNSASKKSGSEYVFATGINDKAFSYYEKLAGDGYFSDFKKLKTKNETLAFRAKLTNKAKSINQSILTELWKQSQPTTPTGNIPTVTTTTPTKLKIGNKSASAPPIQGGRANLTGNQLDMTNKQLSELSLTIKQATQLQVPAQKLSKIKTIESQLKKADSSSLYDDKNLPAFLQKQKMPLNQSQAQKIKLQVGQQSKKMETPFQKIEEISNKKVQQVKAKQGDYPLIDDIVRSSSISVKNKVNAIDYLRTPDRVLKKIGLDKEATLIKESYNKYLDELPKEIDRVSNWSKRVKDKESSRKIFRYLDGQKQDLTSGELQVAKEIKQYLSDWADRLNLPQDKRIASYITHIFEKDFIEKEFDPELAKIIADKVPSSVYDPFLQQRLGKKGYVEDVFRALDAYVKRATRKANMDGALEQLEIASSKLDLESLKYVKSYADRINLRPTDIDNLLDNFIKSTPIGYKFGQRPTADISRKARQMVYRGTLGLNIGSAIRNLTQGVNTYAKLGEKYTSLGYIKVTKALATGSDELERVGVLRNNIIEDRSLSATKKVWENLDKGLFYFFEMAEKINRGSAYFGAKQKALDAGLSDAEAIKAGVEMARKTQFTFGSVDTPVVLQSDLVKLATQFQSFNVKQTEFLSEMVKNKEYAGMIRWAGANAVILATIGQAMGWDWKDIIPFGGILEGRSPVGGTPVFQFGKDALTLATGGTDRYGNPMKPTQLATSAIPFIPGGVQILNKTIPGLYDVNRGYATSGYGAEKLLDMATGNDRRIKFPIEQSIRNYIQGATLGTNSLPEARQYKKDEVSVLGDKQSETFRNILSNSGSANANEYYNSIIEKRASDKQIDAIKATVKEKGQAQLVDDNYFYLDGDSVKTIDLSFTPTEPKLTGQKELDKKLISKYKGEITKKKNDITTLYEQGVIDAQTAEAMIAELDQKTVKSGSVKVKKAKAKKPKKVTLKSVPKSSFSVKFNTPQARKIRIATGKVNLPKIKLPTSAKSVSNAKGIRLVAPEFRAREVRV